MEDNQEKMAQTMRELMQQLEKMLKHIEASSNAEAIPNQMRTTLKAAKRVIEFHQPQDEKTARTIGIIGTPRENYREAKGIALHLYELNNNFVMLNRSFSLTNLKTEQYLEKTPEFEARAGMMERKITKIEEWRGNAANLETESKSLYTWQIKRQKEINAELELLNQKIRVAQHSFNSKYHVSFDEAPFEIERIRKEIDLKRSEAEKLTARAAEIKKELDAIVEEYRDQKQIADNHPDRALIYDLLEQMRETPASARASLQQMQLERHLDEITKGKNK